MKLQIVAVTITDHLCNIAGCRGAFFFPVQKHLVFLQNYSEQTLT